jgi:thermolysin
MKKLLTVFVLIAGFTTLSFAKSVPVLVKGQMKQSVTDNFQYKLKKVEKTANGTHMRLTQTLDGIEVWGGEIIKHYDTNNNLVLVNGRVHTDINVGTVPFISSKDAENIVSNIVDDSYAVTTSKLVVFPAKDGNYYLTYIVNADKTDSQMRYFVDAEMGMVVNEYDNLNTRGGPPTSGDDDPAGDLTAAIGSGIGVLDQTVSNLNTAYDGVTYQAINMTRGAEIKTYIAGTTGRSALPGTLATDSDNYWTDGSVVDAHKYLENVYDFYKNVFGRNSFDNNDSALIASVHYGTDYVNAYWNGSQMVFGDGDGVVSTSLAGGLDVIGHELSHAVTQYTSDLIYQDESGALNEAFSDIMGACVEFYTQPEGFGLLMADWWMGEDIWYPNNPFGDALRYMDDPHLATNSYTDCGYDPCHYEERYVGTADYGGVHINSTIGSHWFYLLAHGGTNSYSGITVSGIGLDDAEQIAYLGWTQYMPSGATFSDARTATLSAAAALFGSSSTQYQRVEDAWTAVGVF